MESENEMTRGLVGASARRKRRELSGCMGRIDTREVLPSRRREGVSLFNLQRWLGSWEKQRRVEEAQFVELEARPIVEQVVIGMEGAWLEVEGGFDGREVRVLASIVREAARC
jgi:hypothetical protein